MNDILEKLPAAVKHIKVDNKDVFLVATAHVSNESVEDVKKAVELIKPDAICVELCAARYKTIQNRDHWKKMDIFKVVKEGNSMLLLSSLIMSSYQKRIGEKLGATAGAEMLEGIKLAKETGAELVLADRDIQVTLKRTWGKLGFFDKAKMCFQLLLSLFNIDEIDNDTIEELKQSDQLQNIMQEFSNSFPMLKEVLIDERDSYCANSIKNAPGKKVVAILGAGHVPGIVSGIDKEVDIDKITTIPPSSNVMKVVTWLIPSVIFGLLIYGFLYAGVEHSVESIYIWVLVNGSFAALGALIAFGHPLTILAAFVAAPFTSLNPMIAAGWVSGLVQAWVKKPTVDNLERLPEEINSIKGFWRNPVTRILLVVVMSNIGSGIATFVSGGWIAARLIGVN